MVDNKTFEEYYSHEVQEYRQTKAIMRSLRKRIYPTGFWKQQLKCPYFTDVRFHEIRKKPLNAMVIYNSIGDKVLVYISRSRIKSFTQHGTVSIAPMDIILLPNPHLIDVIELIFSLSDKFDFQTVWSLVGVSRSFNKHFGSKEFWNRHSGYSFFLERMKSFIKPPSLHPILEQLEPLDLLNKILGDDENRRPFQQKGTEAPETPAYEDMRYLLFAKILAECCSFKTPTQSLYNFGVNLMREAKKLVIQNQDGWESYLYMSSIPPKTCVVFQHLTLEYQESDGLHEGVLCLVSWSDLSVKLAHDKCIQRICTKTILTWIHKDTTNHPINYWLSGMVMKPHGAVDTGETMISKVVESPLFDAIYRNKKSLV